MKKRHKESVGTIIDINFLLSEFGRLQNIKSDFLSFNEESD